MAPATKAAQQGFWPSHTVTVTMALAGLIALSAQTLAADGSAIAPPATVRFASLKSDRVNLRTGPGTDYPTTWVYRRAGLPLEVLKEYEGWRQVRDADGATGWVLQHFLSGRRTALVTPWDVPGGGAKAGDTKGKIEPAGATAPSVPQIDLYADSSERARVVAKVEAGVIANILGCDGRWCQVSIDTFRGYLPQKRLWGVYEGEVMQ